MPTKKPSSSSTPPVTPERIAERAYELFIERGGHAGYHVEDWLQAERELSGANGEAHAAPVDAVPKAARKRAATSAASAVAEQAAPIVKTEKPKAVRSTTGKPAKA